MSFHFTLPKDDSSRNVLADIVRSTLVQRISNMSNEEVLASFDAFEAAVNAGDYQSLNKMTAWNAEDGMEYFETLDAIGYETLAALGYTG